MTFAQFIRDDVQSSHKLTTYYIFISFKITLLMIKLQVLRMIQMICSGKKESDKNEKKNHWVFFTLKKQNSFAEFCDPIIQLDLDLNSLNEQKKFKEIVV